MRIASKLPMWLEAALRSGEIDEAAARTWASIESDLGTHYTEGAAAQYWKTEMSRQGETIPQSLHLPSDDAEWPVGDDGIENWLIQQRKTLTHIAALRRLIQVWRLAVKITRDNVVKLRHHVAPGEWSTAPNLVFTEMKALLEMAERYEQHRHPTSDFEQEVQFTLVLIKKKLDQTKVFDAYSSAVEAALSQSVEDGVPDVHGLQQAAKHVALWVGSLSVLTHRCMAQFSS